MLGERFDMSVENAKKFFEDLNSDSKLQDELKNVIEKNNNLSDEQKKNEIASFAKTKGYNFSPDDLDGLETSIFDFSSDELSHVAGGGLDETDYDCAILMWF